MHWIDKLHILSNVIHYEEYTQIPHCNFSLTTRLFVFIAGFRAPYSTEQISLKRGEYHYYHTICNISDVQMYDPINTNKTPVPLHQVLVIRNDRVHGGEELLGLPLLPRLSLLRALQAVTFQFFIFCILLLIIFPLSETKNKIRDRY